MTSKLYATKTYGKLLNGNLANGENALILTGKTSNALKKMEDWLSHYPVAESIVIHSPDDSSEELMGLLEEFCIDNDIELVESDPKLITETPDASRERHYELVQYKPGILSKILSTWTVKELEGDMFTLSIKWYRNGKRQDISLRGMSRKRCDNIARTIGRITVDATYEILDRNFQLQQENERLKEELEKLNGTINSLNYGSYGE